MMLNNALHKFSTSQQCNSAHGQFLNGTSSEGEIFLSKVIVLFVKMGDESDPLKVVFTKLQNIWIKYFTTETATKEKILPGSPIFNFVQNFNLETIPKATVIKKASENPNRTNIILPQILKLGNPISPTYFEMCAHLGICKLSKKELQTILNSTAIDLMRAFIAFSYQFNQTAILSSEKNILQLIFRRLPTFLKYPPEFPSEIYSDFLIIFENFLQKFSVLTTEMIYQENKGGMLEVVQNNIGSFLYLLSQNFKNKINSPFILEAVCSYLYHITKCSRYSPEFLKTSAEFFILISNTNELIKDRDITIFSYYAAFLYNIIVYGQSQNSDEWISVLNMAIDSLKRALPYSDEYLKGIQQLTDFDRNSYSISICKLIETIYRRGNALPDGEIGVTKKIPDAKQDTTFSDKNLVGYNSEFEPRKLDRISSNMQVMMILSTFVTVLEADQQNLNSFIKLIGDMAMENPFMKCLLIEVFERLILKVPDIAKNTDLWDILFTGFTLSALNEESLCGLAIGVTLRILDVVVEKVNSTSMSIVAQCLSDFINKKEPIAFSIITNYLCKKSARLLTFPVIFDSILAADAAFRDYLINENDLDVLNARACFVKLCDFYMETKTANTLIFCNPGRTKRVLHLMFDDSTRVRVVLWITNSLSNSNATYSLINSIKEFLSNYTNLSSDKRFYNIFNSVILMVITAMPSNDIDIAKSLIQSRLDAAIAKFVCSVEDKQLRKEYLDDFLNFVMGIMKESDTICGHITDIRNPTFSILTGMKPIDPDIKTINKCFNVITGKIVQFTSNMDDEQIIVHNAIPLAFALAVGSEYFQSVMSAFVSLTKSSISNQYQFFRSGVLIQLIDYINCTPFEESLNVRQLFMQVATIFFHKQELAHIFNTIIKPPMTSSSFFLTSLRQMIYMKTDEDSIDAFFHLGGSLRKFEIPKIPIDNSIKIGFMANLSKSQSGNIMKMKMEDDSRLVLMSESGRLCFVGIGVEKTATNVEVSAYTWHHIVVSFTGNLINLMVDNETLLSIPIKPIQPTNASFEFGPFVYDIEDINISNSKGIVCKYSAHLTRGKTIINLHNGPHATFGGLSVPFTPSLVKTLISCGGPSVLLPFFKSVNLSQNPEEYIISILSVIKEMAIVIPDAFKGQRFFRVLNSVLRDLTPDQFTPRVAITLWSIWNDTNDQHIKDEIRTNIFKDPSLLINLHPIANRFIDPTFFSGFGEVINGLSLANITNNPLVTHGINIISHFNIPMSNKDAIQLIKTTANSENMDFSRNLLHVVITKLHSNEKEMLYALEPCHYYFPFLRYIKSNLQLAAMKVILTISHKVPKDNDDLRSVLMSAEMMADDVTILANSLPEIFKYYYGFEDSKEEFSFKDAPIDELKTQILPLALRLLPLQTEEMQNEMIDYYFRMLNARDASAFRGWELILLYFMQYDNDHTRWIPIIVKYLAKDIESFDGFLILFEIVCACSMMKTENVNTMLLTEMTKSMISYHVADVKFMTTLMIHTLTRHRITNCEKKRHDTPRSLFEAIKEAQIVEDNIKSLTNCPVEVNFTTFLLRSAAYGGGLSFANNDVWVLFSALLISLSKIDLEATKSVISYLSTIAAKTSYVCNFKRVSMLLKEELVSKNEWFQVLEVLEGSFLEKPSDTRAIFENRLQEIIDGLHLMYAHYLDLAKESAKKCFKDETDLYNEIQLMHATNTDANDPEGYSLLCRFHNQNAYLYQTTVSSQFSEVGGLWCPPGSTIHRKLSPFVDQYGRHGRMVAMKHFDDHLAHAYNATIKASKPKNLVVFKGTDEEQEELAARTVDATSFKCCQVTVSGIREGTAFILKKSILFESNGIVNLITQKKTPKSKISELYVGAITHILLRYYQLIDCALEIFTDIGLTVFLSFPSTKLRSSFIDALMATPLRQGVIIQKKRDADISKLTKKWSQGLMSNFEYLYWVNMYAGRSFNDVSQYPVFPWIIKDYTSERLDYNGDIYRDLSKPIGALNEHRITILRELIQDMNGTEDYALYRSFFSSLGCISSYFIRVEPFTTLSITLQSNHFDNPNRLFHSLPGSYRSATSMNNDFRELTPEFFSSPSILQNANHYEFGNLIDGSKVDDVTLPRWAKTADQFISIHLLLLESSHVSESISDWIDLIFGYKQGMIEYDNLFSKYCYLDSVEPSESNRMMAMNFGISPLKIFQEPHPKKIMIPRNVSLADTLKVNIQQLSQSMKPVQIGYDGKAITEIDSSGALITFQTNSVSTYKISQFSCERSPFLRHCSISLESGTAIMSAPWRSSVDIMNIQTHKVVRSEPVTSRVTVVSAGDGGSFAAGTIDSSVIVWPSLDGNSSFVVGHSAPIVDVFCSRASNLVVSVDQMHTLLISSLVPCHTFARSELTELPLKVLYSHLGYIVAIEQTEEGGFVELLSEEGAILRSANVPFKPTNATTFRTADCGSFVLVVGGTRDYAVLRTHDLVEVLRTKAPSDIVAMAFSPFDGTAIMALSDDHLIRVCFE